MRNLCLLSRKKRPDDIGILVDEVNIATLAIDKCSNRDD